ncbi:MAG: exonuclease domain-containing protein [Peptococcaceae bacterium]|nr:exonuclease domain-containing protein [Peptococcaceae bacterium]
MQARNYVVLDLETTGLQPGVDEIIEVGAVKLIDGQIVDRFHQLIQPRRQLPLAVERLTGISAGDLIDMPRIEAVLPDFVAFIGDLPVVAHNALFDLGFLTAAWGKPITAVWLDTVELARLAFPLAPNYRLSSLAKYLNLELGSLHRAPDDAAMTAELLIRCLDKMEGWDLTLIHQLNLVLPSGGLGSLGQEVERKIARRFPNRLLRPGLICLAQDNGEEGLFARANDLAPPLFAPTALAEILGPTGIFAQRIPNYQFRSGQVKMLNAVVEALNEGAHLVVEAGTGTGKSLAYLLPAVAWAVSQREKVVIATHTINLQEQLWDKDLPLVRSMAPFEFSAAIVKGRSNYVCLRKWVGVWTELEQMLPGERAALAPFLTWLNETVTGDRAELNLPPGNNELWSHFSGDSESCLGSRCRFYSNNCFVTRARRKAERADVLIVNHSLLMSDAKTDNMVLPEYSYLIIDEAHHLESSATEHLGNMLSDKMLEHYLRLLRPNALPPGLFGQLKHRLPELMATLGELELSRVETELASGLELLNTIQEAGTEFFAGLEAYARNFAAGEAGFAQVRLKPSAAQWHGWSAVNAAGENLNIRCKSLGECLNAIAQALAEPEEEELAGIARDVNALSAQIRELGETAWQLLDLTRANLVAWVESDARSCRLRSAPVEVGSLLREMVFAKTKATILTSATLAVNNSFEHLLTSVGMEMQTKVLQVESPFKYDEQALICIPRDLPDPTRSVDDAYTQATANMLIDLVRTIQGRTLVLFTAHKMLRDVYGLIKPQLEAEDIQVLGHNLDGGRGRLVEEFKANPRTVLLGASSFWEGVDIQGDTLTCVVIVKLPFWPPSMPTLEARLEQLAQQNKDGFRTLSIPQAVIRLKQGFGRLIRTQEDRGVVVILDNRILDKNYGRKFLNSLPLKTHIRGDSAFVLHKIRDWLATERHQQALRVLDNPPPAALGRGKTR